MGGRTWPTAWPIGDWMTALEASQRAAGTVDRRTYHVARFARSHPDPWAVTTGDVEARLAGCRTPEYAKSVRASLHMFYVWAIRDGRTMIDPTVAVMPIRVPRRAPRPCPDRVLGAAMMGADDDVRLMLLLMAHCGLRRAECAQVHTDDVDGENLWVVGKGGVRRTVRLTEALQVELAAADGDGYLFPGRWGHAAPDTVGRKVAAALGGRGWTAHTLRHRYGTIAYRTKDLFAVQRTMGHASPQTTAMYVQPDDAALALIAAAVDAQSSMRSAIAESSSTTSRQDLAAAVRNVLSVCGSRIPHLS